MHIFLAIWPTNASPHGLQGTGDVERLPEPSRARSGRSGGGVVAATKLVVKLILALLVVEGGRSCCNVVESMLIGKSYQEVSITL